MSRRDKIQDLLLSLNALSFDDDRQLDEYLEKTRTVVQEVFGDYNSYLTCLSYIRFHPLSPMSSAEENVRFWARAKKELRDLLFVMLDDPLLYPSEPCRSRVLAQFTDEEPVPRYEIHTEISDLLEEFKNRLRADLELVGSVSSTSFQAGVQAAPLGIRRHQVGPRSIERVRIDLRDLFIMDRGADKAKEQKIPVLPKDLTKRILFIPGSGGVRINDDVLLLLRRSEASVVEGEPLTPGGASIQEQFARFPQITAAVMVLSDDCLFQPKMDAENGPAGGPFPASCFALGFLVGHLGRKRVIAIYTDGKRFKRPTNYFDAVYIAYDRTGLWKKEVATCLDEQGIGIKSPSA